MKTKTALAALVLAFAPAFAYAECSSAHEVTMSCADGKVWDAKTASCITPTG
ncbi:adenylosuccinate lyase [Vannielia litorea]|uniref:chitin-binding domain-containing protein n=1 Tax=Vannielia TaxID=2813041 RepID=UPI001C941D66|nr:chitin-binding domain-containing protein [Vannielia litorea]MBY6047328.1 adenylosuccinate lyase [Vannielia litorea]MBY6074742.1 adenylosuccinate lyase [Vannielia litorea]MBY6152737.1 adenylosuccinate lyase [Vannielia litorea]